MDMNTGAGTASNAGPKSGKLAATIFYSLFADLDLAVSLLKTARVMPTGQKRLYERHAVKIHQDVSQKVSRMNMPSDTRELLDKKLRTLTAQLPVEFQVLAS